MFKALNVAKTDVYFNTGRAYGCQRVLCILPDGCVPLQTDDSRCGQSGMFLLNIYAKTSLCKNLISLAESYYLADIFSTFVVCIPLQTKFEECK